MADVTITGPVTVDSLAFCEVLTAQVAIAAGKAVFRDASNSGKANLADSSAASSAEAIGIAVTTAGIGEPVVVAKSGATITQAGTTFAKNVWLFVSTNGGGMAPVADITSGLYGCALGVGISTTQFKVQTQISGVAT